MQIFSPFLCMSTVFFIFWMMSFESKNLKFLSNPIDLFYVLCFLSYKFNLFKRSINLQVIFFILSEFCQFVFQKNFFISSNYKIYRIKIVGFPYFFNTCRVYILLLLFFFISLCRGLLIFFALNLLNRGFLLLPYKFIFLYFRCHSFFFSVLTNIIESKSIDKETTYIVSKLKLMVHLYPI